MKAAENKYVVEASALMTERFAYATDDLKDIYFDDQAARAAGYKGRIAPPMFLASMLDWTSGPAESELREDGIDVTWFPGVPADAILMGGGQDIDFIEPVYVGSKVSVERVHTEDYRKEGKAGPLRFMVTETTAEDETGREVMRITDRLIIRG